MTTRQLRFLKRLSFDSFRECIENGDFSIEELDIIQQNINEDLERDTLNIIREWETQSRKCK